MRLNCRFAIERLRFEQDGKEGATPAYDEHRSRTANVLHLQIHRLEFFLEDAHNAVLLGFRRGEVLAASDRRRSKAAHVFRPRHGHIPQRHALRTKCLAHEHVGRETKVADDKWAIPPPQRGIRLLLEVEFQRVCGGFRRTVRRIRRRMPAFLPCCHRRKASKGIWVCGQG